MQSYPFYEETLALTKEFVGIPSVNGTTGERDMAQHMAAYLETLPYMKEHPAQLICQPLRNDPYGRLNVIALALGNGTSKDTILLHGHCDTVRVEDYGSLMPYAFDCDALPEKIRALTDDPEVLADIDSGEWLFGRGASDMKCGDAVNLALFRYFTEHREQFKGNLIFMTNPVEENQHTGIMESLDVLEELAARYELNYKLAINTDFISPAYPGDPKHYFHAGAVGKILPCFYVIGKPTHVGQAYEGFSATLVTAEILRRMDLRTEFCDVYEGEYTLPPTALRARELKPSYDVQTPFSAFLYFNYFIHNMEMDDIFLRLRRVAEESLETVSDYTKAQHKAYCDMTGTDYHEKEFMREVLSYEELYHRARAKDASIDSEILKIAREGRAANTDLREVCLSIVAHLSTKLDINTPTVIVFLSPPYCPRNTLKKEIPAEAALITELESILQKEGAACGETLSLMQFFPVLTDSSYLKIDDSASSMETLMHNFPCMEELYPVPIDQIRRLNIPALNFGCHGKDAHKWTERVHKEYSFGKLPLIILHTLEHFIGTD